MATDKTNEEDLQDKYCDLCGSTTHNQSEHDVGKTRYKFNLPKDIKSKEVIDREVIDRIQCELNSDDYEREIESLSDREKVKEILFLREGIRQIFAEGHCNNLRPKRNVICQRYKNHVGRHTAVIYWG
jgi:hypothetical protein